jgi:hypothetical protein
MQTMQRARAQQRVTNRRAFRWSLLALAFAITTALAVNSAHAEEEEKCSDFTENNRPCTATQQLAYCVDNAMDTYTDCLEDSGWLGKLGCTLAYEADFWACGAQFPIGFIKEGILLK